MVPRIYFMFTLLSLILISVKTRYIDIFTNHLLPQHTPLLRPIWTDQNLMQDKIPLAQAYQPQDKVRIDLYYESLCPDCRQFDTLQFTPTVKKLASRLNVHVYPYGNAQTLIHKDGSFEIKCQHGPPECYGNMLHACAIDNLRNFTTALVYNSCMMDFSQSNKGSDDQAADKCGQLMNINSEPIKTCAKSQRGLFLLKAYGDSSKAADFNAVPYILINGQSNNGDNFMQDVCAAFKNPPQECY